SRWSETSNETTTMTYQSYIKSEFSDLTLDEVLKSHPSVLLGVSPAIEAILQQTLDIVTVFDLGMSAAFDSAARILSAAENPRSAMRRYGRAPTSMIDAPPPDIETAELPYEGIEKLTAVTAAA